MPWPQKVQTAAHRRRAGQQGRVGQQGCGWHDRGSMHHSHHDSIPAESGSAVTARHIGLSKAAGKRQGSVETAQVVRQAS